MRNRAVAVTVGMVVTGMLAGTVHAQSSVTLYGVADVGMVFNSNAGGKQQYALASGNASSSVWGLKGVEDLGGGLSAIFTLENGYSATSGTISQNGTFFGRQAFVGLSGNAGTLTLGRQYSPAYWYTGYLTAGGSWAGSGAGYGAHPGDVDNLDTFARVNNAVKYTTPSFYGFSLAGMYAFGNQTGSIATNRIVAVGGGFARGPLKVGIGYQDADRPNFSFFGNKANDSATANNIYSPVYAGFASAGAQKIFSAAAAYTIDQVTLGAAYSNTRFTDLGTVAVTGLSAAEKAFRGTAIFNIGEANVKFQVTPALMMGAAYSYTQSSGVTHAHYQQVDLALDYALSKRTDLYTMAFYQHASGTDSRGLPAVAALGGVTASRTSNQTLVTAGIRHRF
ncbi:porin [Paraburkholderia bannensis]|uniref:porin n=1 Tax=Paraburkholderia bannensis TaxID=765414 RepID=UPI002AB6638D|nr:porin [Paraburkholderia bannensis]